MKKNEVIIFSIIVIIALGAIVYMNFADTGQDKYVVITVDGEEIAKYPLTDETDEVYEYDSCDEHDYHNKIVIKDGQVNVVYANCPNLICVDTKPAENIGDTIVCLPHKLVVEIVGE